MEPQKTAADNQREQNPPARVRASLANNPHQGEIVATAKRRAKFAGPQVPLLLPTTLTTSGWGWTRGVTVWSRVLTSREPDTTIARVCVCELHPQLRRPPVCIERHRCMDPRKSDKRDQRLVR